MRERLVLQAVLVAAGLSMDMLVVQAHQVKVLLAVPVQADGQETSEVAVAVVQVQWDKTVG